MSLIPTGDEIEYHSASLTQNAAIPNKRRPVQFLAGFQIGARMTAGLVGASAERESVGTSLVLTKAAPGCKKRRLNPWKTTNS